MGSNITGDANLVGDGSAARVIKADGGSSVRNMRQEIKKVS